MTTALDRAGQNGMRGPDATPAEPQVPGRARRVKRLSWFARDPAWPIVALCVGWPVWWFLGIGDYFPVLLAIPMIRRMWLWRVRNERTIRLPPGFAIWAMFLVVVIAGVSVLSLTAPETVASSTGNRVISWALRTGIYLAVTVLLVYAGNLTEQELPRRRLAWLLGLVGIYTAVGGFIGVLAPHLQFTSPLAYIVPKSIQAGNGQLQMMLHPGFTQVQNILGYDVGRPRAPFDYTNMWGNCLAILLPWLIVAWWCYGNRRERRNRLVVLAIAFVPVVYSLDRGLWVGLGLSVVYLAVRFAARGKLALLAGLCGGAGPGGDRGGRLAAAEPDQPAAVARQEQRRAGVAVRARRGRRAGLAAHRLRGHPARAGQHQLDRGRQDAQVPQLRIPGHRRQRPAVDAADQ